MNLQEMLFVARSQLRDLHVKQWSEAELVAYANLAKDSLISTIRQAREDYFLSTTTSTVATTTSPNASTVTLPADFLELKDLMIITSGYEDIEFIARDRVAAQWHRALIDGGSLGNGTGMVFYDIVGNSTLELAPGFDVELSLKIDYIKDVADMYLPTDTPTDIPTSLHNYIPTEIVCHALRTIGHPKLSFWEAEKKDQLKGVAITVQPRTIRDIKRVTGFMEEEEW